MCLSWGGGGHNECPSLSFLSCPSDLVLQPPKQKNCIIVLSLTGALDHQTERGMGSSWLLTIRGTRKSPSHEWLECVCHMNQLWVVCFGMFERISSKNIWDLGYKRNMLKGIFVFNPPHAPGEYKTWNGGPIAVEKERRGVTVDHVRSYGPRLWASQLLINIPVSPCAFMEAEMGLQR